MDAKSKRESLQCETVARAALGEPRPGKPGDGAELFWKCSQHNDEHPSLQVNPNKNAWMCGPCGASGNAWELAAFLLGKGCKYERLNESEKREVTDWLRTHALLMDKVKPSREAEASKPKAKADERQIVATYDYTDEDKNLLFQVVRFEPKDFRQRRPDGKGGWMWHLECNENCGCNPKMPPARRVLYNLPEVSKRENVYEAISVLPDTWAQAEADARQRAARIARLPYVLVVEGEKDVEAARTLGFTATCNPMGAGKWRDEYSEFLRGRKVAIIADADAPGHKHAQRVAASVSKWAASVKVREIPGSKDLAEAIEKGTPREALLALFADTPEWKPPTGADVLDAVYNYIRKFAGLSESQARAVTLWVAHVPIYNRWGHTPYLHVYSPERGCGKSTVLDLLKALLGVPDVLVHPSLAALYSSVAESLNSPLLIDEIDKMFNGRTEHDNEIYGFLNAGFQPGRTIPRVTFEGRKRIVEHFSPFCPKALAGIGENALDETTQDRSIRIRMDRASWGDNLKRWVEKFHLPEAQEIGAKLTAWCAANADEAAQVDVWCTTAVSQRVIDIWEPLLALAELAGGNWLEWAKTALIELSAGPQAEHDSIGVKLLKDIRAIKEACQQSGPCEALSSAELAKALAELEDRPWAEFGKARKPISAAQIARLLDRYEIKPRQIWIEGQNVRGYEWTQFKEAWERYAPPDSSPSSSASAREPDSSTSENRPKPQKIQEVGATPSGLAASARAEDQSKQAGIKWIRLSELRAMRDSQAAPSFEPFIIVLEDGYSGGSGLGRATVGGHETAMLDTGNLERATLPRGTYETRGSKK